MSDEQLYARVVAELSRQGPVRALWAKAYAESNGNDQATRARYLRLRVSQLAEEDRALSKERRDQVAETGWRACLLIATVALVALAVVAGVIAWT